MRNLRGRIVARVMAFTLLLIFLQSVFLPHYTFALTTGPHQPEYTSYEGPGATDMVNLLTGDFSFSLPVLEVPGPEGSFSLPLSYNAGIGLDQEASWVGLGWTMNAGAITRTINGFPDDANGQNQTVSVKDLTGLRGWDTNLFGLGRFGWNNQTGHYGNLSLLGIVNATWDENSSAVGIIGYNVGSDGFTQDGRQFVIGVLSVLSLGASAGVAVTQQGLQFSTALAKAVAKDMAIGVGISAVTSVGSRVSSTITDGYWEYSKRGKAFFFGLGVFREYKMWLDQTRVEDMYGTLFLGNAPTASYGSTSTTFMKLAMTNGGTPETLNKFLKTSGTHNQGAASDIEYRTLDNSTYRIVNTPALLAQDNFSVKTEGISGAISPYRLDVGSVSMPREMTPNHIRLAPIKYLPNNAPYTGNSYKVPFIYEGQSNAYFHHVGSPTAVTSPSFHFGVTNSVTNNNDPYPDQLTYNFNDVVLKNERIKSSFSATKKIPQSNYVEWLSNDEIKSSMTYSSGYMDFLSGGSGSTVSTASDRYNFRTASTNTFTTSNMVSFNNMSIPASPTFMSNLSNGAVVDLYISFYASTLDWDNGNASSYEEFKSVEVSNITSNTFAVNNSVLASYNGQIADIQIKLIPSSVTPNGLGAATSIGAFCITAADGTTYHYGLPLYDYDHYTYIKNATDATKNTTIRRPQGFANTWLLTAVTGSDFIDRNANGVVDEDDWGYWVKLNYGIHSSEFNWQVPYKIAPGVEYRRSSDNSYDYFSKGKKQLIYLNSIETRSHVALFKKEVRSDGRDASSTGVFPLRLEEIILLSREHYKKLTLPTGQGGFGVPELSNKIFTIFSASTLSSQALTFIEKNAFKRVRFNHTYDLCHDTDNSVASGGGKLTLKSLSIFGRNNEKLAPDYEFEYGFNPSYNQHHWDGWGMYHPQGSSSGDSHDTQQTNADQNGAAWSLSKIVTPLGSEILVNYERDEFTTESGHYNVGDQNTFDIWNTTSQGPLYTIPVNNLGLVAGDRVSITGELTYNCTGGTGTYEYLDFPNLKVTSATANSVTFEQPLAAFTGCTGTVNIVNYYGAISKILVPVKGEGIRVSSIIMKDELGGENKMRYLYTDNEGRSSGDVAKTPDYIKSPAEFAAPPGYPNTPVIYGQVTLLNGKLTNDNDYNVKQVYEFEKPNLQHYNLSNSFIELEQYIGTNNNNGSYSDYLTMMEFKIVDRTSKIGALKSVKTYDSNNVLKSSSTLTYVSDNILNDGVNNYHGVYTSGVLMADRIQEGFKAYHKVNRTTVIRYPYQLKKIVNYADGFTSESENLSWDLISGIVDQKLDKSNLGFYIKTVTKPAYKVAAYSEMGPKATNISNKNMLGQIAATYVYKSNASGANLGLIGAELQTWSKTWPSHSVYSVATPYGASSNVNAWRKSEAYSWKGAYSRLQADGTHTFNISDEFNFSGTPNANWQRVGGIDRYDQYSMPVQTSNYDTSIFSAVRLGYDNRIKIAEASNAKYDEIAFCSAEDRIGTTAYFYSSGIKLFNGTVLRKSKNEFTATNTGDNNLYGPHTGDAAIMVNANGKTFSYTPPTSGLTPDRTYRASVWTNSPNGRIYYSIDGGTDVISSVPTTDMKAGKWYLLSMEITIPGTPASFEVGVKSVSGKVVFDDFRFQPVDASMTCYVYSPLDFEYSTDFTTSTYVLDNDNLYTRYDESGDGRLSKVYRETMSFGSNDGYRLISETTSDFRRFHTE